MNRLLLSLFTLIALWPLPAQEADFHRWESPHYQVLSDDSVDAAKEVGQRVEAAFQLFSGYFHFDSTRLPSLLRVRIFQTKEGFDAYLKDIVPDTRQDFVLISYADPRKSELLGFQREPKEFNASLLHQGFIQYLNAFVTNAPVWLQAGMAAYLESSIYDPEAGTYHFKPNLAWLQTLKKVLKGEGHEPRFSLIELVMMNREEASWRLEAFYPQAWGLVHFLIHSEDKRYNRVFWDAISALDSTLSPEQNASQVHARAFAWLDEVPFRKDYESFILGLKTFSEQIQDGIGLYNQGKLKEAEESFGGSLALQDDHYIPYYYLGLIHYARKEYNQAAIQYQRASDLGIDPALIHYALGVNAFAGKQYQNAEAYLKKANELDAAVYGEKVDTLLKRIEVLK